MIKDANRIFDGFVTLEAGVDSGRAPNLIDVNQVASAENMTFSGGRAKTRPGFRNFPDMVVDNGTHSYNTYSGTDAGSTVIAGQTATDKFFGGTLQTAGYYSPPNGDECIMALISGRLFKIVPKNPTPIVQEVVLAKRNDALSTGYMCQADKYFIIQDGQSLPIIYDGTTARRSRIDPVNQEVPVGTLMAYGMGRLVVVRKDFRSVTFGDLFGSHDGVDPGDSVIQFTEATYLNEGFDASIPFSLGKATAATFFPQLDTSTGNGQLMIFAERGAASFFLNLDRNVWKTSQFQQLALLTTGLRGWRSISAVNEDLWFRADDGWRSFRQARSEPIGWSHLPLSTNVDLYLDNDTEELLEFANSIYFDNKIIATVNPVWNQTRPYHTGMVVVDFDILSAFGTKYRPAWIGRWSGIKVTQLVTGIFHGVKRAFAFGIDDDDNNALYEFTLTDHDDFEGQEIDWELVTRAFDFSKISQSSNPFTEKELYDADLWLSNIVDVNMPLKVYYRPDNFPDWTPWKKYDSKLGLVGTPGRITQGGVPTAKAGFSPRLSLGKPADNYDAINTSRLLRRGFEFQLRINGTGHVQIDRLRLHAQQEVESSRGIKS